MQIRTRGRKMAPNISRMKGTLLGGMVCVKYAATSVTRGRNKPNTRNHVVMAASGVVGISGIISPESLPSTSAGQLKPLVCARQLQLSSSIIGRLQGFPFHAGHRGHFIPITDASPHIGHSYKCY